MTLYMRDRENIELGKTTHLVSLIRDVDTSSDLSVAASFLKVNPARIKKVLTIIKEHPDWDDEDVASEIMYDEE